jgi:hypothetical protein
MRFARFQALSSFLKFFGAANRKLSGAVTVGLTVPDAAVGLSQARAAGFHGYRFDNRKAHK